MPLVLEVKLVFHSYPQLYVAICQNERPGDLGLTPGGPLVNNLRQRVVTLASNTGVIATVQRAAQSVLHNGWSLLLPTAEERAKALSQLLPSSGQFEIIVFFTALIMFYTVVGLKA